jgi:hypothetical protein
MTYKRKMFRADFLADNSQGFEHTRAQYVAGKQSATYMT